MTERPLSCFYGNPHLRIPTEPGNRIRVFPASDNSASVLPFFCGCDGLHIRASTRMHRYGSTVLCFGTRAHPRIVGFVRRLPMTLPLVTADERARLLAHGAALAAGQRLDPLPVVRLFTPDAHVTWLLVSLDPADGDTAYGLIDLGIGLPSLGTVKLSDLAGIVGPRKLPVRRDRYFQAAHLLSEYVRLAQENGAITD
ncbi:probable lipoprotein [Ralstonia pseudosolanacearum GMI1000]|nr:probable lipoprotein [Ralstonia pseudosolanacearum GMI1000]